jgi:hypothetical protein
MNLWRVIVKSFQRPEWMSENSWVEFPAGARNISLLRSVKTGSGTHLTSYSRNTGVTFTYNKAVESRPDRLPPSRAEVKNKWRYTSTCSNSFMTYTGTSSYFSVINPIGSHSRFLSAYPRDLTRQLTEQAYRVLSSWKDALGLYLVRSICCCN